MRLRTLLLTAIALLALFTETLAQNPQAALATLPEADALVYVSPQRILNEAAPRVLPPSQLTDMRNGFADLKKSIGVDPATIEYLVVAARVNKPATDLSFVSPDVMVVIGGDFSSESLLNLGQLYFQDKVRVEKYGSKSITLMKVDPIAEQAAKTPLLKRYVEIGAVPLSANSLAIGNLDYLKLAIDAADGKGRISAATLESLLRDPNALIVATGDPLASFAKSLGLLGLENASRESRCDTRFGNFYAAVTMNGSNFSLRGAMNADNPDTAKIINNLLSGLMKEGINAVPDKDAQTILQALKMSAKDNEVVWEADIPEKVVADWLKPKPPAAVSAPKPTPVRQRRPRTKRKK